MPTVIPPARVACFIAVTTTRAGSSPPFRLPAPRADEQDWLFTEFVGTPATLSNATLPATWLKQMGRAAEKSGLVIQYCMLWPRFALQALEIPAVTTARGSVDYDAGNDNWRMGLSSLFLDSLGMRPTKDNYFSTDHEGDGSKGKEPYNRLHSLVSTLSTGPVFPADAINSSDVPLIMRACNADGLLLRPDRAATNLDSNILAQALALGTKQPLPGEVQSTSTVVSGERYSYVLSVNTNSTSVSLDQINSADGLEGKAPYTALLAFESNSSSTVVHVDKDHPLLLMRSDRWSFNYWTLVPRLASGWAFLGEARTKWIAVSPQRFTSVAALPSLSDSSDAEVTVAMVGKPGEIVQLGFVAPSSTTVAFLNCTIGLHGKATARMPSRQCA